MKIDVCVSICCAREDIKAYFCYATIANKSTPSDGNRRGSEEGTTRGRDSGASPRAILSVDLAVHQRAHDDTGTILREKQQCAQRG